MYKRVSCACNITSRRSSTMLGAQPHKHEDIAAECAERANTVVWKTGTSPWPYSHLALPAVGVFLLDTKAFPPLAAVAVVTLFVVVLEVVEMLRQLNERKSDVIMDLISGIVGAATGLAVIYALDVPSWGVFGGVHSWRTWLIVAVLAVSFSVAHHELCAAAAAKHGTADNVPVPAGPKPYVFPTHVTACLGLLVLVGVGATAWLRSRGVPTRPWHALVPFALGFLAAAPLYVQPDDQENLRWSLALVGGVGAALTAVAVYSRWPRLRQWLQSNLR